MRYTIRRIPPSLDVALRQRARRERKSLNQIVVEALADGLRVTGARRVRRNLADIAGTWTKSAIVEKALGDQEHVDAALWGTATSTTCPKS